MKMCYACHSILMSFNEAMPSVFDDTTWQWQLRLMRKWREIITQTLSQLRFPLNVVECCINRVATGQPVHWSGSKFFKIREKS